MLHSSPESLRRRLEEIDAQTSSLYAKIATLAAERSQAVEQLKRVTYPILTLPPELTAKIFLHYHERPIDLSEPKLPGPFVLASVCRQWRGIALRLPGLWKRLTTSPADSDSDSDSESEASATVPKTTLERRFRLCESSMRHVGKHVGLEIECRGPESLLPALLAMSDQWEKMDVCEEALLDAALHSGGARHSLARLRRLAYRTLDSDPDGRLLNDDFDASVTFSPLLILENAPSLEHVELVGMNSTILSLPWAQLRSLTLSYVGVNTVACLFILRKAPLLENLTLLELEGYAPLNDATKLQLDHLRSLTVVAQTNSDHRANTVALLSLLVVPALTQLSVEILYADIVLAIRELLIRSAPRLENFKLTINVFLGSSQHLRRLLPMSPPPMAPQARPR
ncbi:F-box domain-containing protein [Mycena indigotica]|uniref:F-box domain-containing protein n=1 Tax=Mycena indigotica TaxID=2126181 RepID=A0A8H6SVW2_9AGAR|nr:F-box domain-containing protein [Mycena indigotica]KAF7306248.1 F-box domain-containing protein [Mycena indigotica]